MTVTFPVVVGIGMTPGPGAAERKRVFRAAQVGDEGLDDPLVVGEPAQEAGTSKQQEGGHEQGGRGAAGMRLALAGDQGMVKHPPLRAERGLDACRAVATSHNASAAATRIASATVLAVISAITPVISAAAPRTLAKLV